jgi:outer membrane lipoprotein SlyB
MSDNTRQFAATVAAAITAFAFQAAFAQAPKCTSSTCGVVQNVQFVEQKGSGSGVGLVAGGVVGGVLGHQIGSGRGNTAATIIGAGAGAYAGNEIEKNRNNKSYWTVNLRMDNGQNRTFTYSNQPTVRQGERAMLIDGGRRLALVAN